MQLAGPINMMRTSLVNGEAKYSLPIGSDTVDMNTLVGRHIELSFQQEITCSNCGKKPIKAFHRDIASHVLAHLQDVTCAS